MVIHIFIKYPRYLVHCDHGRMLPFWFCFFCVILFAQQYGDGRRELVAGIEMVDNLHNQTLEYNLTRQAVSLSLL